MAEPLKNQFTAAVAEHIGDDLAAAAAEVGEPFDRTAFLAAALDGFDALELGPRAQQIADAMALTLPADRAVAIDVVRRSLGPELESADSFGMGTFSYWPHVKFIAQHGHDHLRAALDLQYELTKRFTAEFSIRTYLVGEHRDETLAQLERWASDPSEHVRRLVSEGTRPRLPWAPQLREFIDDPAPTLALLELLRHDGSEYVRRSVANHLNDIAKDHPELVVATCRRWWLDANADERRMIRHALRTLIKHGDLGALDVLGFGPSSPAYLSAGDVTPSPVEIGETVSIQATIENPDERPCRALVDFRVHFVKADGSTSPKVFKGAEVELAPGELRVVSKRVSLRQHSTRTHHPGAHRVEALVNGVSARVGSFDLVAP